MRKKIAWLVVGCLMVGTLALASCGSTVTEEEEEEVTEEEEEEAEGPEMVRDALGKLVEKPQYGGEFRPGVSASPWNFDDTLSHIWGAQTQHLTNETLVQGDWAKGPAGTDDASFLYALAPPLHRDIAAPMLAESWEIVEPDTIIFHIRQGVHFALNPDLEDSRLVNGREMTVDDVVFSIERTWEVPTAYQHITYPWMESVRAIGDWTVEVKAESGRLGMVWEGINYAHIVPREVVEQYEDLSDWRNAVGTGPFILTDYVQDSSATFERNPSYWMKDPLHPTNTLPYVDSVRWLIIPDMSTKLAALRTGQIDHIDSIAPVISLEAADKLIETNPELQYLEYPSGWQPLIHMRVDTPPLDDIRVRRALNMAVNQPEMRDTLYRGHGQLVIFTVGPVAEFADMHTPLEELPESTRELFEYHPEKAKQLLTEAGYPDGFKLEIPISEVYVDQLSVVKEYWSKIGVDLDLKVMETGALTAISSAKSHEYLFMSRGDGTIPFVFSRLQPGETANFSIIDDPFINEAYADTAANYFNDTVRRPVMKEVNAYVLSQAYVVPLPGPNPFIFWQPWVKNYHGELMIRYMAYRGFAQYIWIDQDLKKELTGSN